MGWVVSASDLITKQEDSTLCVLVVFRDQPGPTVASSNEV
jgi:hypothetical protein